MLLGENPWKTRSKRKRSVTMTIRFDEQVDTELKQEAESKNITLNALVNQIVTKYLDWDRHSEKFDGVTIPAESLARLTNRLDDEATADFAHEVAESTGIYLVRMWFNEVTPGNVLKFLVFALERNKSARIAFSKDEIPQRVVGFHRMGPKGGIWFKHYIERLFQLAGKKVTVEANENQFTFLFD